MIYLQPGNIVVGCLMPLACAHLGMAAEFVSEVEIPVEQILLLPSIS
jgi:hypothetical protein